MFHLSGPVRVRVVCLLFRHVGEETEARGKMAEQQRCEPVFFKVRSVPAEAGKELDTIEICSAAEKVSGRGTVRGAQRIRGLWRVYVHHKQARDKLLMEGIVLRGISVTLLSKNPFTISQQNGEEKPATRLIISNIPISVEGKTIETALAKVCELRGSVRSELARNKDGQLTQWETGRRFVIITTPATPLDTTLKVGLFTGNLWYKELKGTRERTCNNCLQSGHLAASCTSEIVCKECRKPGHKRGDPRCQITVPAAAETRPHSSGPVEVSRQEETPRAVGKKQGKETMGGEVRAKAGTPPSPRRSRSAPQSAKRRPGRSLSRSPDGNTPNRKISKADPSETDPPTSVNSDCDTGGEEDTKAMEGET